MDIFVQFLSENTQIFDEKLLKMIMVCPDCAPWRSDQEWRSICADTVGQEPLNTWTGRLLGIFVTFYSLKISRNDNNITCAARKKK